MKKIPETDAIFDQVRKVNREADETDGTLRVSMDAKASVKLGPFSRGGSSRVEVEAADHDFGSEGSLTPFSILLPQQGDLYISFAESKVTSDYIWDRVEERWSEWEAKYRPSTLVINLDNGPENSSRRTQFIKRAVDFANQHRVTIRLAYYPTHHKQIRPCRMAPPWIDCDQRSTYLRRNPPKNEAFVP